MAKLPALPSAKDIAALRGVLWFGMDRGVIVCKRWPRPRPGKGTKNQQRTRDEFKRMAALAHEIMSLDRDTAEQLAKGSQYTWRDIVSRAAVGALIEYQEVEIQGIQRELDGIQTTVGAMLLRTTDGWIGVLPGLVKQLLTIDPATGLPAWRDAAAAGGGLFGAILGTTPTHINTGLATWLNQDGASATDTAQGITLTKPYSGGDSIAARLAPEPTATTYTVTALLAMTGQPAIGGLGYIGWTDGTKLYAWALGLESLSSIFTLHINPVQYNNVNSWHGNPNDGLHVAAQQPLWLRLTRTPTTLSFSISADGQNFSLIYTDGNRTGFLANTNSLFLGINAHNATQAIALSLLSWTIG